MRGPARYWHARTVPPSRRDDATSTSAELAQKARTSDAARKTTMSATEKLDLAAGATTTGGGAGLKPGTCTSNRLRTTVTRPPPAPCDDVYRKARNFAH